MSRVLRFEWERVIRRAIVASTVKHVGLTLATYADKDGRNARPSVATLAATCALNERTVRRSLESLRELGLVERTFHGSTAGRKKLADVYSLMIPVDIFDRVELLPVDERPIDITVGTVSGVILSAEHETVGAMPCENVVDKNETAGTEPADTAIVSPDHRTLTRDHRTLTTGSPDFRDPISGHEAQPSLHDHPTTTHSPSPPSHRSTSAGSAPAKVATA